MGTDASRIEVQEGAYPFRGRRLDQILLELASLTTCANTFINITRTDDLISLIEFFTDAGRTTLDKKIEFTRTTGNDGIDYITGMVATYYEFDGVTVDSQVTVTITRDGSTDLITQSDNVFSTSESTKL